MIVYKNGIYQDVSECEMQNDNTPEIQIEGLKEKLSNTDYKAIKFAEGLISEEDYAPTKKQRQEWRNKINLLEAEL